MKQAPFFLLLISPHPQLTVRFCVCTSACTLGHRPTCPNLVTALLLHLIHHYSNIKVKEPQISFILHLYCTFESLSNTSDVQFKLTVDGIWDSFTYSWNSNESEVQCKLRVNWTNITGVGVHIMRPDMEVSLFKAIGHHNSHRTATSYRRICSI